MRALGALTLTIAMLTKSEAAGLADQRIDVKTRQAISSLADNRPVILARATWQKATLGNNLSNPVMSFSFPAASLAIGDQIHIHLSGLVRNDSGGTFSLTPQVRLTGGTTIQNLGGPAIVPNAIGDRAWTWDVYATVSLPGVSGQYLTQLGIAPNSSNSQLSMNRPNTAIAITGTASLFISTVSAFGPSFGGFVYTSAVDGSSIWSLGFQQVFDSSQPLLLEVQPPGVPGAGVSSYTAIEGGWIMGM